MRTEFIQCLWKLRSSTSSRRTGAKPTKTLCLCHTWGMWRRMAWPKSMLLLQSYLTTWTNQTQSTVCWQATMTLTPAQMTSAVQHLTWMFSTQNGFRKSVLGADLHLTATTTTTYSARGVVSGSFLRLTGACLLARSSGPLTCCEAMQTCQRSSRHTNLLWPIAVKQSLVSMAKKCGMSS